MCIISKRANNVKIEEDKITYEVSGMLVSVEANGDESYINLDTGEQYPVSLTEAKNSIDGIDMSITIQVSIKASGEMKVKYLGEYHDECDGRYIGCKCHGMC